MVPELTAGLLSAGYQGYKKHCRRGGAEDDGEDPSVEENPEKRKEYALENGGFEFEETSATEGQKKDTVYNTDLWDHHNFHQGCLEFHFGPKDVEK